MNEPVSAIMTPKVRPITVKEGEGQEALIAKLQANRIEKILMVNDAFQLRGMIRMKDIQLSKVSGDSVHILFTIG